MSRPRVYISGPMTLGDREHNFKQASDAHRNLIDAGFAPLNPILTMRLPWAWDVEHAAWIESDLPWIRCAHALLRLPGESVGADQEVAHAVRHGIRVYRDVDALIADRDAL